MCSRRRPRGLFRLTRRSTMVRFLQEVYCIGLDPESAMDRYARKEPGYHDQDYKAFWRVLRSKLPCKHLEEDLD